MPDLTETAAQWLHAVYEADPPTARRAAEAMLAPALAELRYLRNRLTTLEAMLEPRDGLPKFETVEALMKDLNADDGDDDESPYEHDFESTKVITALRAEIERLRTAL